MKRLSKVLSVALCLAMLISCIPGVVFTAKATEATITQPNGVSIVENYDDYVGEDWVAQLGMPAKVTTSEGEADVQWEDAAKYVELEVPGFYAVPGTVNGVAQAVYFPVQVREYTNLLAEYNGSLESNLNWSVRDNKNGFVTSPVKHGQYATGQILPATWTKLSQGYQAVYSYDGQSATYAGLVAAAGAGDYWFGMWGQIGPDTVNGSVTDLKLSVQIHRTTEAQTTSDITYMKDRMLQSQYTLMNTESYTRSGLVAHLDGTDEHLRFYGVVASWNEGTSAANDELHLDNIELVPLKLALTDVPAIMTGVASKLPALGVIKNYDSYAGENWQTVLDLPTEVDVVLDNGETGKASVKWDFSNLDLSKTGWYVLTGNVSSRDYMIPNPLTVQQVICVREYENLLDSQYAGFDVITTASNGVMTVGGWIHSSSRFDTTNIQQVQNGTGLAIKLTQVASPNSAEMCYYNYAKALATSVRETGAGQYLFGMEFWTDTETTQTVYFSASLQYGYYDGSASTASSVAAPGTGLATAVKIPTQATFLSTIATVDNLRAPDKNGEEKPLDRLVFFTYKNLKDSLGTVYMDNAVVLPLKIDLGEAPATITEVTSKLPALSVIKDYNTYVGENWQTALDLPAEVEVKLADGETANAAVQWDFSKLDVTKLGRYEVIGSVTSDEYPILDKLSVKQVIYVSDYENILKVNPSFEDSIPSAPTGWAMTLQKTDKTVTYYSNLEKVASPLKEGTSALKLIAPAHRGEIMYTNSYYVLAKAIKEYGDGQYYFSAWGWSDADTTDKFYLSLGWLNGQGNPTCTPGNNQNDGYVYFTKEPQKSVYITNITNTSIIDTESSSKSRAIFRLNKETTTANMAYYLDDVQVLPLKLTMPDLVEPTIKDASLALQNNLAIKYTALAEKFGTAYTAPYMVFSMNGKDTTVEGVVEGDSYVFWFKNIAPHQISDTITATLHATFNGVDVVLDTVDYSVLTYCKNKIGTGNAKLDTLLADLINYSVELQKSLNKTPLDTTGLDLSAATKDEPKLESGLEFVDAGAEINATWKSAALILKDAVTVRLYFKTTLDISNVTVKIQSKDIADKSWTLTPVKDATAEDTYYVDFNGLNAAQMRAEICASIYNGETAISEYLLYSVETYAFNKQAGPNGNLVKAMMKYGDSAAAYNS